MTAQVSGLCNVSSTDWPVCSPVNNSLPLSETKIATYPLSLQPSAAADFDFEGTEGWVSLGYTTTFWLGPMRRSQNPSWRLVRKNRRSLRSYRTFGPLFFILLILPPKFSTLPHPNPTTGGWNTSGWFRTPAETKSSRGRTHYQSNSW